MGPSLTLPAGFYQLSLTTALRELRAGPLHHHPVALTVAPRPAAQLRAVPGLGALCTPARRGPTAVEGGEAASRLGQRSGLSSGRGGPGRPAPRAPRTPPSTPRPVLRRRWGAAERPSGWLPRALRWRHEVPPGAEAEAGAGPAASSAAGAAALRTQVRSVAALLGWRSPEGQGLGL